MERGKKKRRSKGGQPGRGSEERGPEGRGLREPGERVPSWAEWKRPKVGNYGELGAESGMKEGDSYLRVRGVGEGFEGLGEMWWGNNKDRHNLSGEEFPVPSRNPCAPQPRRAAACSSPGSQVSRCELVAAPPTVPICIPGVSDPRS